MIKRLLKDRRMKDLSYSVGANLVSLLAGVIVTFVIPKKMSYEEYSYLKLFTLYLGYVGFFHLGFNDGIYVNYGNCDYENLPKKQFRAYFKFLAILQALICIVLALVFFKGAGHPQKRIIYLYLAINIFLVNLTGYFEFISQIVRRFKIYSFTLSLNKITYTIGALALIMGRIYEAKYLVILQTGINLIILLIYIFYYKDIIFGACEPIKVMKSKIKSNISMGFFIMLGNFVSLIIIGVDRIVIERGRASRRFTDVDFATYSFAVSLLSMVYVVLNAVRSVAYPYLARRDEEGSDHTYSIMKTLVFIALGYCLSGYFLFHKIVEVLLPNYIGALAVTAIIFPTVMLSGEINIVTVNFFKIMKLKKEYSKNSIVAVCISLITIAIAYFVFGTKEAIATSSLISFYLWNIYGDRYFNKAIGVKTIRHHIGETISIAVFLLLAFNVKWYIGFILYIVAFTAIVMTLFKKEVKMIFKRVL